jgi:predicted nucleic acid-binding protein
MTAPIFVDTNVFIYALDDAHPNKQQAAREWRDELWKSRTGRTSFQVLQEFYVNVRKKWPGAVKAARVEVRDLLTWHPVTVDAGMLERAWQIQDRYQLSFWDALVIAAARASSCRYLLTEDLQEGQNLDGVTIINPFRHAPGSFLASL